MVKIRIGPVIVLAASLFTSVIATPPPTHASEPVVPVTSLGPSESPSDAHCRTYVFHVKQFESSTERQSVWGQLCHDGSITSATPVQILIHGGSYNHTYWDLPFQPTRYSYVGAATRRGYATLNIDRLGYGNSDSPLPITLDFKVAAYVTHQLVTALRSGAVGHPFNRVILNGHSMGGLTAQEEAAYHRDVDAVIVSGIGHNIAPAGLAQVVDKFYPADLDPKFILKRPPGYLTTLPGMRARTFIEPGSYDPAIVPVEEGVAKDTLSPTELTAVTLDTVGPHITDQIEAPVLFAQGQYDLIWCARTKDCYTDPEAEREVENYATDTSFTRVVIPDAGHSINSNINAPQFYDATFDWLDNQGLAAQ